MDKEIDDLEAVRIIIKTLEKFSNDDKERIIRWVQEKLGLIPTSITPASESIPTERQRKLDLRSFINEKNPATDTQFVAAVAYYYQFEAPESEKKISITADDLLDACRKVNRTRPQNAGQTLRNALRDGLVDREDEGSYKLNAVGENLVAMSLPVAKQASQSASHKPK